MKRVQQRRGVKLPPNAKSVARPSRWGNPFPLPGVQRGGESTSYARGLEVRPGEWRYYVIRDRDSSLAAHRVWARSKLRADPGWLDPLRGFDLACYCEVGQPCHGDTYIELLAMQERDRIGRERYGTPLQAHNGRDALVDAYQEALDLVVYLRQAIAERTVQADLDAPARSASEPAVSLDTTWRDPRPDELLAGRAQVVWDRIEREIRCQCPCECCEERHRRPSERLLETLGGND